jgi:hypothetical protein
VKVPARDESGSDDEPSTPANSDAAKSDQEDITQPPTSPDDWSQSAANTSPAFDDSLDLTFARGQSELRSTTELQPGESFGRYVTLRQLGEGGMGVVYEAFDPQLERRVALKLINCGQVSEVDDSLSSTNSQVAQARLLLEAKAQAKLVHPNVVAVYDVGYSPFGVYMAMELVPGQTLKNWCRLQEQPIEASLRYFLQAARGLAAAHAVGLVHRDFKPDNLLLGDDAVVRVADFGLAIASRMRTRPHDHFAGNDEIPAEVVGTPSYMPPEQHRGEVVNERGDQFSFFVALYEAITGTKPFAGKTREERLASIKAGAQRRPPGRRSIPRSLWPIVCRGLAFAPELRFADMREVIARLEERLERRHPAMWLALAAAVLCTSLAVQSQLAPDPATLECEENSELAAQAWSPQVWQEVDKAFRASSLGFAGAAYDSVWRNIGERVAKWGANYRQACVGLSSEKTESARIIECLDKELKSLTTIADIYRQATPAEVQSAVQVVSQLSDPDACLKSRHHRADADRPQDPRALASYFQLKQEFEGLKTLELISGAASTQEMRVRFLEDASSLGNPGILAAFYSLESHAAALELQLGPSLLYSDRARIFAQASQDDQTRAEVLRDQVFLRGYKVGIDPAAEDIFRTSQALLVRAGNDPLDAARACASSVPYMMYRGQGDAAEQCLRAALDTFSANLGPNHPETVRALEYLAVTISIRRFDSEAESLLLRAKRALMESVGGHHPQLAMTNYNLSSFAIARGSLVDASAYLAEISKIAETSNIGLDLLVNALMQEADTLARRDLLAASDSRYAACLDAIAAAESPTTAGPQASCTLGRAKIAAKRADYSACWLLDEMPEKLRAMNVGGLYGEQGRGVAYASLRDLALLCGEFDKARTIENERKRSDYAYSEQVDATNSPQAVAALAFERHTMNLDAYEAHLRRAIGGIRWYERPADRVELLEVRAIWADVLLELGRPQEVLTILETDAPIRIVAVGNSIDSLWHVDLLRARAYFQLGRYAEVVSTLQDVPAQVSAENLDALSQAYLMALLGQAHVRLDHRSVDGRRELVQAAAIARRLRVVPAELANLLVSSAISTN